MLIPERIADKKRCWPVIGYFPCPYFLDAFGNRRIFFVLLLGFSSGIPLALTGTTLQAWMATEKVDLALTRLLARGAALRRQVPLVPPGWTAFVPPFLGRRRRVDAGDPGGAVRPPSPAMAFSQPKAHPGVLASSPFWSPSAAPARTSWSTPTARRSSSRRSWAGRGGAHPRVPDRDAHLGAIALILADRMPWRLVYLIMAGSLGRRDGRLPALPEPRTAPRKRPRSLREAVVEPFLEFFGRPGAAGIPVVHRLLQARCRDGHRADHAVSPRAGVHEDRTSGR